VTREAGSRESAALAAGLKIVRGTVDDDELAALVAGMIAVAAARNQAEESARPTSAWMDRQRTMRGRKVGVLGRGDSAWRHSLR
jgi:hypothetical protein